MPLILAVTFNSFNNKFSIIYIMNKKIIFAFNITLLSLFKWLLLR